MMLGCVVACRLAETGELCDLEEDEDGWGWTHHNMKAQNTIL